MKNIKKTALIAALIMTALSITLLKYEKWSFSKDEEDNFHSATLTLVVGADRHDFVYGDPLTFFDDFARAQKASDKESTLIIGDSHFAGAGIARIRCEINAHSQNVNAQLDRKFLAGMQICHCSQRSELTYLDKLGNGVARLGRDINDLIEAPRSDGEARMAFSPNE